VASLCCALAARRIKGHISVAWWLLAASAASWGLGEVIWAVYEVGLGISVPFPSAADAGYLAAIPLAVAGVLTFAAPPRGTATSVRLWVDGLVVGLSLIFVGWALGLSKVYLEAGDSLGDQLLSLAYPVGDIVIGTALVLAIRRATQQDHVRLLLLLAGLASNALADSAFAYLTAGGNYGSVGSVLDTAWVAGYLLIALAALWPARPDGPGADEAPIDVWQLALPWFGVFAAGASAVVLVLRGQELDQFLTVVAGLIAISLMLSQIFAHLESRSLLIRTRLLAATLNEVIVHAPLGVVRLDSEFRIVQANPGFANLLRASSADLAGSPISRLFPDNESARLLGEFRQLTDNAAEAIESTSRATRSDGSSVWLHWSATAVRNTDGDIDYFIGMFEDTTSRHHAEAAAVANLSVLERLNRMKTEFLTMVSHEFRTALVGIQGFSELLRDTESLDVNEARTFAEEVFNDARRLDQMLDKMLALDRESASQATVVLGKVNLNNVIGEVVGSIAFEDTSHRFVTQLAVSQATVRGDSSKLSQLVRILVDNAARYSPAGSEIAITSRIEPGVVEVDIRDHGPGMPADFDNRSFGRHPVDGDNPTSRVVGGGLGLPMAREIVELHGGRIWFDSAPDAGTEFHITIPAAGSADSRKLRTS